MLIVCNGAIKSGSTWLYNILTRLVECEHPPAQYLTGRSSKSPCLRPDMFESFLRSEDYHVRNFISKNHLAEEKFRQLFQADVDVFIFDIERDP
jgi:hypothetical protein